MLSKEDTQLYYDQWINVILKLYIKNFGTVKWLTPSELLIKESNNRIPWENKISDNFIIASSRDHTLLAKDILGRGMYWPFFTIDNYVLLGVHRLESLQLYNTTKEFLCVELNSNHVDYINLKYENNTKLDYPLILDIPTAFEKPIDARSEFDYLILKNKKNIRGKFTSVEVNTYRDLIDVLRIIPHWIKNDLFLYSIIPSKVVNSKEEFAKWIGA